MFYGAAGFIALHAASLLGYLNRELAAPLFLILLGASAAFVLHKPRLSALPLVLNLLLDSSGHLFEFHDISLRLALLLLAMAGWLYHAIKTRTLYREIYQPFTAALALTYAAVAFAAYTGLSNGHATRAVIADAIPFAYLMLYYPFKQSWPHLKKYAQAGTGASYAGAAFVSVIILTLFATGLVELQEPLYKWLRDIVAGKVTSTGNGFYRIVTPLHLLLAALLPYLSLVLLKSKKYTLWFLATLVISLNFSRMYFLAIIPATLVFSFYRSIGWKRAATTLLLIGSLSTGQYTLANVITSAGSSAGFEFLSGQAAGIADPGSEASASARAAILPHLIEKIKDKPLFGEGLGSTVTYYNPFSEKELTTPHLDWGYMELAVEFGIALASLMILMLLVGLWHLRVSPSTASSLIFLLAVTVTTPALFHVYGISLISALYAAKGVDKV